MTNSAIREAQVEQVTSLGVSTFRVTLEAGLTMPEDHATAMAEASHEFLGLLADSIEWAGGIVEGVTNVLAQLEAKPHTLSTADLTYSPDLPAEQVLEVWNNSLVASVRQLLTNLEALGDDA